MKKLLSIALVAVMLLTVSAALADDTTVFIPAKLSKLGVELEPSYMITLTTSADDDGIEFSFSEKPDWAVVVWPEGSENLDVDDDGSAYSERDGHLRQPGTYSYMDTWSKYDAPLYYVSDPAKADDPSTVKQTFDATQWPVPDKTDPSKQATKSRLVWTCDPLTGLLYNRETDTYYTGAEAQELGIAHFTGGNYAYYAGKGEWSWEYSRDGQINSATHTINTDYFDTGLEVVKTEIKYSFYKIKVLKNKKTDKWGSDSGFYVSSVKTSYADSEDSDIVEVETQWRNDDDFSLATYKITYATSETEQYKITYAPATSSTLGYKTNPWDGAHKHATTVYNVHGEKITIPADAPDMALIGGVYSSKGKRLGDASYVMHCTEDEVLCGLYTKGSLQLVSGSGKKLGNWYKFEGFDTSSLKNKSGKQYKNSKYGLKKCTAFPSPRVK